jgi:RNA polymerase sigma-70 factor (ECF subfamily)
VASRTIDVSFAAVGMTDAQLVARCLARDTAAERELYDRHVDRVYRLAHRLCGDADRASDCTQETFIRAFARLAQFRGDAALGTWLNTITVSVVLNAHRRERRFEHRREELDDSLPHQGAPIAPPDLRRRLYEAIDQLPDRLRPVFVMHDVEGYTHEEIGGTLGIPTGTSKARLSDARARLRVALSIFAGDLTA